MGKSINDKMTAYVENNAHELYIGYDDVLTTEQVTKLLESDNPQEAKDEIAAEITDFADMQGDDLTYYWDNAAQDTGLTLEQVTRWRDSVNGFYPATDVDIEQMLKNTSAHITARVATGGGDFSVYLNNAAYGQAITYSDVKELLDVTEVNPREFKRIFTEANTHPLAGNWPNMPRRDNPAIDVKALIDNILTWYDGEIVFLFNDLQHVLTILDGNPKYITLKAGTPLYIYNFWNGAGVTDTELTRDLTIERGRLSFEHDDAKRYGVQECYGLIEQAWNGSMSTAAPVKA